ncbi:hypothetical protein KOW79_005381 [Hemibagrus wyckioides]|uniref:Uncharacterized protein n=1 Tax=Hemibagrus wyckioides TaxID=337641 RepID=A0A9D3P2P3_9TELE|nr:hypothetical protein KOW79_005381 [Hemibagrus wyckioides]
MNSVSNKPRCAGHVWSMEAPPHRTYRICCLSLDVSTPSEILWILTDVNHVNSLSLQPGLQPHPVFNTKPTSSQEALQDHRVPPIHLLDQ